MDGLEYEQTKISKFKGLRVAKAKDIVTKRDERTLDKMPSRTIVMYIYRRHSTGFWIGLASLSWLIMFVIYLSN